MDIMSELYENEIFIYNHVPVRVLIHSFDGENIFTPLHWHRNIEFNITTAGRILYNIDGQDEEHRPGALPTRKKKSKIPC